MAEETRMRQLLAYVKTAAIETKALDLCRQAKIAGIPPKQFGQFLMEKYPEVWEHVVQTRGKTASKHWADKSIHELMPKPLDDNASALASILAGLSGAGLGAGLGYITANKQDGDTQQTFNRRRRIRTLLAALGGGSIGAIGTVGINSGLQGAQNRYNAPLYDRIRDLKLNEPAKRFRKMYEGTYGQLSPEKWREITKDRATLESYFSPDMIDTIHRGIYTDIKDVEKQLK